MKVRICTTVISLMASVASPQTHSDRELAQTLSDGRTREAAVAGVVAAGAAKVPILLSWTKTPPSGVERTELYVGVAMAFGALRTKEAIPFLIQHISLQSWISSPDVWMKTPEVVEDRLPAVKALIQIGPEAAKALLIASWDRMGYEDRLASLVVMSRVGEGPAAREFILRALGEANLQRDWAEGSLRTLESRPQQQK